MARCNVCGLGNAPDGILFDRQDIFSPGKSAIVSGPKAYQILVCGPCVGAIVEAYHDKAGETASHGANLKFQEKT